MSIEVINVSKTLDDTGVIWKLKYSKPYGIFWIGTKKKKRLLQ